MKLEIRGEAFDIKFVNNWCREQYQLMLEKVDDLVDIPNEIDDLIEEKMENRLLREKLRTIKKRQREYVRDIADIRFGILKELLETNGYKYDAHWWMRKADANDMNTFVLDCLQKDLTEPKSKKK